MQPNPDADHGEGEHPHEASAPHDAEQQDLLEQTFAQIQSHWAQGNYDQAVAVASEAIGLGLDVTLSYWLRAQSHLWAGDYDCAIADATEAIQLDPCSASAYRTRAEAHRMQDQYEAAIVDINAALRLDAGSADAPAGGHALPATSPGLDANDDGWANSADPLAMLQYMEQHGFGSPRKFRLFACAIWRLCWTWVCDDNRTFQGAIAVPELAARLEAPEVVRLLDDLRNWAESLGDYEAEREEVADAEEMWGEAEHELEVALDQEADRPSASASQAVDSAGDRVREATEALGYAADELVFAQGRAGAVRTALEAANVGCPASAIAYVEAVRAALDEVYTTESQYDDTGGNVPEGIEPVEIVRLLHDIIGNPLRPVRLESSWLTGAGVNVVQLAEHIFATRDFSELPQLGDALEDAGCTDASILGHCRGENEHVRGCWVIDLISGRH